MSAAVESILSIMEELGLIKLDALERARFLDLTPREWQILRHIAEGLNPPKIATKLGISGDTVRGHIQRAYSKLGVHSLLEAAAKVRPYLVFEQLIETSTAQPLTVKLSLHICQPRPKGFPVYKILLARFDPKMLVKESPQGLWHAVAIKFCPFCGEDLLAPLGQRGSA